MMADNDVNKVNQKHINANKVIGRDDNSQTTHNHIYPAIQNGDKNLKKLLEEHERERTLNPEYKQFSDELNMFFRQAYGVLPRSLEEKLTDGGRNFTIPTASAAKERVTKKIEKFANFSTAQEIFTYLLTNIRTAFTHEVQSKIKSGEFNLHQIDEIVTKKIIAPYLLTLEGTSLGLDKTDLYGLLYFLTGNCYVEWD